MELYKKRRDKYLMTYSKYYILYLNIIKDPLEFKYFLNDLLSNRTNVNELRKGMEREHIN
jgi:hypothetical protein